MKNIFKRVSNLENELENLRLHFRFTAKSEDLEPRLTEIECSLAVIEGVMKQVGLTPERLEMARPNIWAVLNKEK